LDVRIDVRTWISHDPCMWLWTVWMRICYPFFNTMALILFLIIIVSAIKIDVLGRMLLEKTYLPYYRWLIFSQLDGWFGSIKIDLDEPSLRLFPCYPICLLMVGGCMTRVWWLDCLCEFIPDAAFNIGFLCSNEHGCWIGYIITKYTVISSFLYAPQKCNWCMLLN